MLKINVADLTNAELLGRLHTLVAQDRATTAALLAHLAEVDARRLYAPAGYSSMHAWCVGELHFSDDMAFKRIHAARAARRFPALYDAVADGRLHLAAVRAIAPHLDEENYEELVAAATHRTRDEIEDFLAERSGRFDACGRPLIIPESQAVEQAPGPVVGGVGIATGLEVSGEQALGPVDLTSFFGVDAQPIAAPGPAHDTRAHVALGPTTRDKLRYAQELLSHAVPAGDAEAVIDRALDLLIAQLEKRKFGAAAQPRDRVKPSARRRHIPAQVRREVWLRDEGKCTFTGEGGHRCATRELLEFDHVLPLARGGKTTAEGLRLRCRAHNQLEAERVFGQEFIEGKRRGTGPDGTGPETRSAETTGPETRSKEVAGPETCSPGGAASP